LNIIELSLCNVYFTYFILG